MKKLTLSVVAVMAMGTFAIAGGDIAPVEPVIVEEVAPIADDSGFYIGLGYTYVNTNANGWILQQEEGEFVAQAPYYKADVDVDVSTSMTSFIAGYKINQYFAVEGRYVPQFLSVDGSFDGESGDVTLDTSNIALYAKGMYPIGDFSLYALLGYGQTTVGVDGDFGGSFDEELSDSGFQWGIGAAYALSEHTSLFIDYSVMYDDNDFDGIIASINEGQQQDVADFDFKIDAITFGMTYKF